MNFSKFLRTSFLTEHILLLLFELLHRDKKDLDFPHENINFLKTKIKDCALLSFKSYNEKRIVSNSNKDEISAVKTLSNKMI